MSEFNSLSEPTSLAAGLLDEVAKSLEIPDSRYQAAERSYKSLAEWLKRSESRLANFETEIYPQGSFRLGTVIKPLNEGEEYDLDVVCEIPISKSGVTQAELKALVGQEVADYAKSRSMQKVSESRRCWTLNYADGAQFHMDVIPSVPDAAFQKRLIEARTGKNQWADTAIAITDREHPHFRLRTEEWPGSNPVGYANWFLDRTKVAFERRRSELALLEKRANVEEIPAYRVKTPLQSAIQILKRHRDIQFADDPDNRPISIILTTLAAHAYGQEETVGAALFGILGRMDRFISYPDGVAWIPNPTDPRENFADRWVTYPERREAFSSWLRQARADFSAAGQAGDLDAFSDSLAPSIGRNLVESAVEIRRPKGLITTAKSGVAAVGSLLRRVLGAPHKIAPRWPMSIQGTIQIARATYTQRGKTHAIKSDGMPLKKGGDLRFEAQTNIQPPYSVYWQVVNTGREAEAKGGLRGGFEPAVANAAGLVRKESTEYRGTHSIECLVVKNGTCVARSEPFIVTIS